MCYNRSGLQSGLTQTWYYRRDSSGEVCRCQQLPQHSPDRSDPGRDQRAIWPKAPLYHSTAGHAFHQQHILFCHGVCLRRLPSGLCQKAGQSSPWPSNQLIGCCVVYIVCINLMHAHPCIVYVWDLAICGAVSCYMASCGSVSGHMGKCLHHHVVMWKHAA